ncbi:MAG: hypothetical protein ACOY4T_03955 [Pseudomonadota bacterium]
MSENDWTPEVATALSPEVRLCRAIIARVIEDLFGSLGPETNSHATVRKQALAWLTASAGSTAWDRDHLCSLAGLDGEVLRRRVIAILEGRLVPGFFSDTRRNSDNLTNARALWAVQNAGKVAQRAEDAKVAEAQRIADEEAAKAQADWLARRKADAEKRRKEAEEQAALKARIAARREEAIAAATRQDAKIKQSAALLRLLREGPKTTRELVIDMRGSMDTESVRYRLNKARDAGLVELHGIKWSLVSLPQTAGALPDPVVEQPVA